MRIARGLYGNPREREARPQGGFDLAGLVRQARSRARFDELFGQRVDLVALVMEQLSRIGLRLPEAAILETLAEV